MRFNSRIGDRHIANIIMECAEDERRSSRLWERDRDTHDFDNAPGLSSDEFGHIMYVNSRRVFFDQINASIKFNLGIISVTA